MYFPFSRSALREKVMIELRQALEGMGRPQPPAVARAGSEAGCGVLNGTMRQRRSKVADMSLTWLKDRCERGQFKIEWAPGPTSRAGYAAKSHPGPRHQLARPAQLYAKGRSPTTLQGCDRITGASRPTKGTKIGLLDKLKSSLPNISSKLCKLTF